MISTSARVNPVRAAVLRVLLCSGVAATLGAPAFAQSSDAAPETELAEITVVGSRPIAESEEAALQLQREFPSLVSIVSADAVGRLPDQNIAFAVGRLPGIGIQRDQGQARYVNLRGAPTNWTTLSFDGINIVSPEGRTTRFDNVPSALASQIWARKAVTADMPGETLAGNINVVTRSPFDYDGFNVAARAGLGYVDLGGGEEIDSSLVFSNVFADGRFGALVSASYYKREMATDNFENDWEPVAQDRNQPGAADRPLWAREIENKLYRLTRYNQSGSLRLGWRPDDRTDLFLTSIYTEYRDNELRSNIKWDADDRQSSTPTTPCSDRPNNGTTVSGGNTGYADICTGNTPFRGTLFGIDFDDTFNHNDSKETIWTTTLGGDHVIGAWNLDWRLNYTEAEDGAQAPALSNYQSPSNRLARPSIIYDLTDRKEQKVEVYRTIQNPDGSWGLGQRAFGVEEFERPLTRLRRRWGGAETEAYTARVDALREVGAFGRPTDLKLGLEFTERTKTDEQRIFDVNAAGIVAAGLPRMFGAIANDRPYKGDFNLGYSFRYHDAALLSALVDRAIASGQGGFSDVFNYEVTEQVLSGYVMGTAKYDWGNVIAGVRVEETTNKGKAPFEDGFATSNVKDTLVFPSVHVNWDLRPDMKLRLSANTGAARPDYDDLAPSLTVNDDNQTAAGGNPNATPERAWGIDAYYEWYLQPRGILSLGVFYKDVSDVLFTGLTQLGPVSFPDGIDRSDYTLSTLVNGSSGEITGVEFAYQQPAEALVERMGWPDWLGGFGIQANATFTDSEATAPDGRKVSLPGTSDLVYNVIAYYEKFNFSVRLSYQFRTEWLSGVSDGGITAENGGDTYWDDDEELDFSLRYTVNENFQWFFDASNLTNGPGMRYSSLQPYTIEYEQFGRRFMIGVRLGF